MLLLFVFDYTTKVAIFFYFANFLAFFLICKKIKVIAANTTIIKGVEKIVYKLLLLIDSSNNKNKNKAEKIKDKKNFFMFIYLFAAKIE